MAVPPNSNAVKLAQALVRALETDITAGCRTIATRFGTEDPLESAATWVEAVALDSLDRNLGRKA